MFWVRSISCETLSNDKNIPCTWLFDIFRFICSPWPFIIFETNVFKGINRVFLRTVVVDEALSVKYNNNIIV